MANPLSAYQTTKTGAETPKDVTATDADGDKYALDVSVSGGNITATLSGLNIAGRITQVTLSDTGWTALPPTPLTNRNAISIQNQSSVLVKLNYDNTEPTFLGVRVEADSERYYEITDNVIIYAKAETGTPTILIEELS